MSKTKRYEKGSNPTLARAMQELRRSSAAQPYRNKARYNRKVKHKGNEDA